MNTETTQTTRTRKGLTDAEAGKIQRQIDELMETLEYDGLTPGEYAAERHAESVQTVRVNRWLLEDLLLAFFRQPGRLLSPPISEGVWGAWGAASDEGSTVVDADDNVLGFIDWETLRDAAQRARR
jgi:hypothetical protein